MTFSIFTRLWYLEDYYLKGLFVVPVSQDVKCIVCSSSVHYQPLGPKRDIFYSTYALCTLYDIVFSGLLNIYSISWEFNNNLLNNTTNLKIKISRDKSFKLVKTRMLKMSYDVGKVEHQSDYVDDKVQWSEMMENIYGRD